MQFPNKSTKGLNIRKWLVDSVDALIECVTWMRVRPGPGIAVKETPAGTVVSLSGQAGHPQTAAPVALVRAGEGIRIDNGMASSVYVPGSTAAAVPVNGATFTCLLEGAGGNAGGAVYYVHGYTTPTAGAFENEIHAEPNACYLVCSPRRSTGALTFDDSDIVSVYPVTSGGVDDGGDVLISLPTEHNGSCYIDIYIFTMVRVVVLAPDAKNIIETGTNHKNFSHPTGSGQRTGHIRLVYVPAGLNSDYPDGFWHYLWG